MTAFDSYSAYYDLLYQNKDYSAEARYVLALIDCSHEKPETLLELGCGTGLHAAILADMGLSVTGIDMSPTMLRRAEERLGNLTTAQQSRLTFSLGDIRTVRLRKRFDAVASLFHVVSYQLTDDDLMRTFTTAREHMNEHSTFVFDFWYGPAVLRQQPEVRFLELENEKIRVSRIARPELRDNANIVGVNYKIIVENKADHTVRRIEERHEMRYLFLPELERLLSNCGLRMASVKSWMQDGLPSIDTWSAVIVAQRNDSAEVKS